LRDAYDNARPNCAERVPSDEADLAFVRVLETFADLSVVNDEAEGSDGSKGDAAESVEAPGGDAPPPATSADTKRKKHRRRHPQGPVRRTDTLFSLPLTRSISTSSAPGDGSPAAEDAGLLARDELEAL
jgi:hypothetical protein